MQRKISGPVLETRYRDARGASTGAYNHIPENICRINIANCCQFNFCDYTCREPTILLGQATCSNTIFPTGFLSPVAIDCFFNGSARPMVGESCDVDVPKGSIKFFGV